MHWDIGWISIQFFIPALFGVLWGLWIFKYEYGSRIKEYSKSTIAEKTSQSTGTIIEKHNL